MAFVFDCQCNVYFQERRFLRRSKQRFTTLPDSSSSVRRLRRKTSTTLRQVSTQTSTQTSNNNNNSSSYNSNNRRKMDSNKNPRRRKLLRRQQHFYSAQLTLTFYLYLLHFAQKVGNISHKTPSLPPKHLVKCPMNAHIAIFWAATTFVAFSAFW